MAKRYSGDIELRIICRPYRGWNGKMGLFYFASIAAPGHRGRAILSLREVGIWPLQDPKSPESYDKAAVAFLELADQKEKIGRFASRDAKGKYSILRVQHAPCPVDMFEEKRTKSRRRA